MEHNCNEFTSICVICNISSCFECKGQLIELKDIGDNSYVYGIPLYVCSNDCLSKYSEKREKYSQEQIIIRQQEKLAKIKEQCNIL